MPQDKNKPNQGRGSNDPSQNTAGNSEAEEIDWLILSDLSTKMNPAKQEKQKNSSNAAIESLNEILSDDQEDIDWLQSIGLDEPVTGITAHITSGSELPLNTSQATMQPDPKSSNVGDIDWLIVTDLKTRMDDTDFKLRNQPAIPPESPQNESLDFSFSDTNEPNDAFPELLEGFLAQDDLGLGDLELSMDDRNFDLDLDGLSIDDEASNLDLENELGAINFDTDKVEPDDWASNSLDLDLSETNEWNLSEELDDELLEQPEDRELVSELSLESNEADEDIELVLRLDLDAELNFDEDVQEEFALANELDIPENIRDELIPEASSALLEELDLDVDLSFDEDILGNLDAEANEEFDGTNNLINTPEDVINEMGSGTSSLESLGGEDFGDINFDLEFDKEPNSQEQEENASFETEPEMALETESDVDLDFLDENLLSNPDRLLEHATILETVSANELVESLPNQFLEGSLDLGSDFTPSSTIDFGSTDDWLSPSSLESSPEIADGNLAPEQVDDFATWDRGASTADIASDMSDMNDDWASSPSFGMESISPNLDSPDLSPAQMDDFAAWDRGASTADMASDMNDDWASSPSFGMESISPNLDSPDLSSEQVDDFATWDRGASTAGVAADIASDMSDMNDDWASSKGNELEANAYELEANAYELEANAYELEANAYELEASAYELEANAYELEQFSPQADLETVFEQDEDRAFDQELDSFTSYASEQLENGFEQNLEEFDPNALDRLDGFDAQPQVGLETFDANISEQLEFDAQLEQELEGFIVDTSGYIDDGFNLQTEEVLTPQYEISSEAQSAQSIAYSDPNADWDSMESDLNNLEALEPVSYLEDSIEGNLNSNSLTDLGSESEFEYDFTDLTDSELNPQFQQGFEPALETEFHNDSSSDIEFGAVESNDTYDSFDENHLFEAEIDRNDALNVPSDLTAMLPPDITEVIDDLDAINTDDSAFDDLGFEDASFKDLNIDEDNTALIGRSDVETQIDDLENEFDDLDDLRQAANRMSGFTDIASQKIPKPAVVPSPQVENSYQPSIPAPPIISSQITHDDSDRMTTAIETGKSDFLDDFDLDNVDTDFMNHHLPLSGGMTDSDFDRTPPPPIPESNDSSEDSPYRAPMPMPLPPLPSRKSTPKPPTKPIPSPPRQEGINSSEISGGARRSDISNAANTGLSRGMPSLPSLPFDVEEEWSGLLDSDEQMTDSLFTSSNLSDGDRSRATTLNPNRPPSQSPSQYGQTTGSPYSDGNTNRGRKKPKGLSLPSLDELDLGSDNDDWTGLLDMNTQISSGKPASDPTRNRFDTSASSTNIDTREPRRSPQPTMSGFAGNTRSTQFASRTDNSGALPSQRPLSRSEDVPNSKVPPAKVKRQIPTVDFETLWQKYLKFPVIGLGAIGLLYVGFLFLKRPIIELGLKVQLLKDVSGQDFSGANFKDVKLDDVNFSKANLSGANLEGASLKGANFVETNLDGVTLTKANLKGARLIRASIVASNLKNAQLPFADLHGADLTRSSFLGANLEGASLAETKIGKGADRTKFESKDLLMWQIINEPKAGRNLTGLNLSGFNLNSANLKNANLTEAKLSWADLTSANLSSANLTGATLNGANLSGANLKGADLTDIKIDPDKQPQTNGETICPNGSKGPCKFQ